jgi:hypothetical protein
VLFSLVTFDDAKHILVEVFFGKIRDCFFGLEACVGRMKCFWKVVISESVIH